MTLSASALALNASDASRLAARAIPSGRPDPEDRVAAFLAARRDKLLTRVLLFGLCVHYRADPPPLSSSRCDRRVNLVVTAAAPLLQLYQGERLQFEFQRAQSRLTEMQTPEYLSQPHRP